MRNVKPVVFISKCIEQLPCRWNGAIIASAEVKQLLPFIDLKTACPEADIGLGIPRDPIRLELHGEEIRLVQPSTQRDLTNEMTLFSEDLCRGLKDIDGFILKSKSPSCGFKEVKIYANANSKTKSGYGAGIFGQMVMTHFPHLMIEDEGRLTNLKIRDHFLTAIFTLARFREIKKNLKMADLVAFHASHKFLFLAYNQKQMRVLGKITANLDKRPIEHVFEDYQLNLRLVFKTQVRIKNVLNVWMHIMGFFSEQLNSAEKQNLLDKMDEYVSDTVPASVVTELLYSLCIRFNHGYLLNQYFFKPYPKELMNIHDSARRRI